MVAEAGGRRVGPGPLVKIAGQDRGRLAPAPSLGEHTEAVLTVAGYSAEEVDGLRKRGVI
jgi:crotonobetainyl-CoA:carnitine CoA-transferase CaiB-like acyl-CoA transferase